MVPKTALCSCNQGSYKSHGPHGPAPMGTLCPIGPMGPMAPHGPMSQLKHYGPSGPQGPHGRHGWVSCAPWAPVPQVPLGPHGCINVFVSLVLRAFGESACRNGIQVSNSCRMGACQSCKLRSNDATQVEKWQSGLTQKRKDEGYFLACRAKPEGEVIKIISSDPV